MLHVSTTLGENTLKWESSGAFPAGSYLLAAASFSYFL